MSLWSCLAHGSLSPGSSCHSQSPSPLLRIQFTSVGSALVFAVKTRSQSFQEPGLTGGLKIPQACQRCSRSRESPYLERSQTGAAGGLSLPRANRNGMLPQSDISVGLSGWQLPCPLCRAGHHGRALLSEAAPCPVSPGSCPALGFGSSLWSAKATAAPVRCCEKCSEGLRAQGTRKHVVLVC